MGVIFVFKNNSDILIEMGLFNILEIGPSVFFLNFSINKDLAFFKALAYVREVEDRASLGENESQGLPPDDDHVSGFRGGNSPGSAGIERDQHEVTA